MPRPRKYFTEEERRAAIRRQVYEQGVRRRERERTGKSMPRLTHSGNMHIPDAVLADRDRRKELMERATLSQIFFGDPVR